MLADKDRQPTLAKSKQLKELLYRANSTIMKAKRMACQLTVMAPITQVLMLSVNTVNRK